MSPARDLEVNPAEPVEAAAALTVDTNPVPDAAQQFEPGLSNGEGDDAVVAPEASDDAAPDPAPPKPAVCGVCNANPPKYKCPRCRLPYCSVACNKIHRENHPPDPEPKPAPVASAANVNAPPAPPPFSPANPFHALDGSDQLRLLFRKYPNLPTQLLQIHEATLPPPPTKDEKTAGLPASVLKRLPGKKDNWNHDIGIQKGKAALRKARRAEGEEGDGVREYSQLILHLMNSADANTDVTMLLREQLTQKDSKLIEQLMAEEKR